MRVVNLDLKVILGARCDAIGQRLHFNIEIFLLEERGNALAFEMLLVDLVDGGWLRVLTLDLHRLALCHQSRSLDLLVVVLLKNGYLQIVEYTSRAQLYRSDLK